MKFTPTESFAIVLMIVALVPTITIVAIDQLFNAGIKVNFQNWAAMAWLQWMLLILSTNKS